MSVDWSAGRGVLVADGKQLEWASFGDLAPGKPVLVLLHEGLGCLALWRDTPERISAATGLPVFAYSRAGYGQSDATELPRPLDYMTQEAVKSLPEVIDAIGAQEIILVGHSDGATISAIYAGSVADYRVRGLVLMAPHFFTEEMGLAEIAKAGEAFEKTDLKEKMAKYHRDPEATFRGWCDAWLSPGFKAWNVADVIDYLRIPTLVIQGREDQYGTLRQVDEVSSRSYAPVDIAILDNCKHSPHLEQPEQTCAAISEFAARLVRIEQEEVEIA